MMYNLYSVYITLIVSRSGLKASAVVACNTLNLPKGCKMTQHVYATVEATHLYAINQSINQGKK